MTSLSYEAPSYVEQRRQPRSVVVAIIMTGACETLLGGFGIWLQARFSWHWMPPVPIWLLVVAAVALMGLLFAENAAIRGRVAVYGDHLILTQSLLGVPIYRRRVRCSAIRRCEIRRRTLGGKSKSDSRVRWFGSMIFMFDGDGVLLFLGGFSEIMIGSGDPDRLLAAINAARSPAEPAA